MCETASKSILDKHAAPPRELIERAVRERRVIPDEIAGPYQPNLFHGNTRGRHMGFVDDDRYKLWFEQERKALESFDKWKNVDIHKLGADWAMTYGHLSALGSFRYQDMKEMMTRERENMIAGYGTAVEAARMREPEEFSRLETHPRYASRCPKKVLDESAVQKSNDLFELFESALLALPALWELSNKVAKEARKTGDDEIVVAWGFKKLLRVKKKLAERYDNNPNRVTDVARVEIVFPKLATLIAALDYLLDKFGASIPIVKNRVREPTADGFVDVLVNVWCDDHLCELQLHLRSVYEVMGEGGHDAYKWFRRLLLPDDVYEGDVNESGWPHGQGTKKYASGHVYEGTFENGRRHGKGKCTFATGTVYEGDWAHDQMEGDGHICFASGSTYHGEWKDGKSNGTGVFKFANGNIYKGDWFDGKQHGKGRLDFRDGSVYDGEFVHDHRTGRGTFKYASGTEYEGTFKEGKYHGSGILKFSDGGIFEGEYENGFKVGHGKMTFKSGTRYEGEWKKDKQDGKGTVHFASGEAQVGTYFGSQLQDKGVRWSRDRSKAWLISKDGKIQEQINLDAAARFANEIGLPLPAPASPNDQPDLPPPPPPCA